jgi:hypothetical protein
VPFPSADELVIEDTSRSGDSISVTIRFRPLRWGSGTERGSALLARGLSVLGRVVAGVPD